MSHKADSKSDHAARVRHHLASGGCSRYARGGSVAEQENEESFDKEVKEVSGKSKKASKPEFKRGGHKASGKKPHHRLDKKARGGETKYARGGKAKDKSGPKINIVVAPHPQGAPQAGLGAPPPQAMMPPKPPMAPPPGAMPGGPPMGAGGPPGMMPPRPGMARGGKAEDGGNEKKGYYAQGGSTKEYKGKQEDLGAKSMGQESNEDVTIHPPKRKQGGSIPHKAFGGGMPAGPAGPPSPGMLSALKNKRASMMMGAPKPMMSKGGAMRHTLRHPVTKRFMKGGSVPTATTTPKMDFGAGGGKGRLEKARKYGAHPTSGKH